MDHKIQGNENQSSLRFLEAQNFHNKGKEDLSLLLNTHDQSFLALSYNPLLLKVIIIPNAPIPPTPR